MSWFKLKGPVATNANVNALDSVNTKMALKRVATLKRRERYGPQALGCFKHRSGAWSPVLMLTT